MIEILECQISYKKGHDSLWVRVIDKKGRSVFADSICSDFYSASSHSCVSGQFSVCMTVRVGSGAPLDNVMLK